MSADGWPALFASAFSHSRNPMVLVDGERRIVDANAAFVRLLGRGRDTLRGHTLYTFVAGGPLVAPDDWHQALADGRFTGEAALVHADGARSACSSRAIPRSRPAAGWSCSSR